MSYVRYGSSEPNTKNKDLIICLEKSTCLYLQRTQEGWKEQMQAEGSCVCVPKSTQGLSGTSCQKHHGSLVVGNSAFGYCGIKQVYGQSLIISLYFLLFWQKDSSLKKTNCFINKYNKESSFQINF